MAKTLTIGSVLKGKDGKSTYIKINEDVTLKKGQFVNLVDPRKQHEVLLGLGLISEDQAAKMAERAAQTPEWVKFNLTIKI